MSGARRKSKNPQKWEESVDQESQSDLSKSYETTGSRSEFSDSSKPKPFEKYVNNLNEGSTSSFLPTTFAKNSSKVDFVSVTKIKQPEPSTRRRTNEGSSGEDGEADMIARGSGTSEGEMTVLDVLQGSRQGLIAECKVCSIQLKDWVSTVGHIRSHRLVFLPLCIRDCDESTVKQSATCLVCQKVCQNLAVLAFHAHTEHTLIKSPSVCPFCGRVFSSTSQIQKHIDIRDVAMKCPVCSAVYNQEYELYSHLSDCLPTFHPHLKSLICHVCKERLPMDSLADHMISHSVRGHETRNIKPRKKSGSSPARSSSHRQSNLESNIFLCEICDRRFTRFDGFRRHLFDHVETKMYCPLCFLKGFDRGDLIVRHLLLRCPRRSREQYEFGTILSIIGKEQNMNFIQVLKSVHHMQPFREGICTWSSIPIVQEMLRNIEQIRSNEPHSSEAATDIELLLWLSDFEREIQKQRLEISNPLGSRSGRKEDSSVVTSDKKDRNYRQSTEFAPAAKRHERIYEDPNKPSVSIQPVFNYEQQTSVRNKAHDPTPSASKVRKNFPGVTLIHEVEVNRLKALYDEALASQDEGRLNTLFERVPLLASDLVRLEWEAQYLRDKEPFYLPSQGHIKEFSPLYKKLKPQPKAEDIDPEALARIERELKENQQAILKANQPSFIDQTRLLTLLQEAKEG